MSTYTYTIPPNFASGVDVSQLQQEILDETGITANLDDITYDYNTDVYITFTPALTAGELVLLNAIVAAHVPDTPAEIKYTGTTVPYELTANTWIGTMTSLATIATFNWIYNRYKGYIEGKLNLHVIIDNRDLEFRLYDNVNATVLATDTIVATGYYTYSISNPISDTNITLDIRKTASGGNAPYLIGANLEYIG